MALIGEITRLRRSARRPGALGAPAAVLFAAGLWLASVAADEPAPAREVAEAAGPRVSVLTVDSIIQPVVAEFVLENLEAADLRGDELLVIELSTPGGMVVSTRQMTSAMLEAKTPTAVLVHPAGAHAASAGFFVLMAADVAAMAPGTNTGAAHPVSGQGQDIEGDMGEKVEQDTAAMIRSLATERGRDPELAQEAVLESRSFTASEAVELGLADVLAGDLDELLRVLDGREVRSGSADARTLDLEGAHVVRVEMAPFQKVRSAIVHPNIAYLLLSLGGLGLYFEFSNPGAVFPGVLGAIFLIVGLYATSVLPVNYAGLALIGLAVVLFVAELNVASFGLFTAGGIASLVLGSLMLFRSADPALRVSVQLVVALAIVALVVVGIVTFAVVRSRGQQVATGSEGLMGKVAQARTVIGPETPGKVFLHGELWNAVSSDGVTSGDRVEVVEVEGLTLHVRPVPKS